ncbi:MAG: smalltalk protein [Prevotella sp.]|nr:smalltalk protein [Prevotella sp.]
MMKNWRTIAKIVVAVITALLGAVGATASGI